MELAHSMKAMNSVFTENTRVFAPSLVEEWTCMFDKFQMTAVLEGLTFRTALLMDRVQLLNFLEDVKDNWERWSVVFGCLGTGMVALSAVKSGSAVLTNEDGVMRDQADMRSATDLIVPNFRDFTGSQHRQKEGAGHEQRQNLLQWSPMKRQMQSQPAHTLASVLSSSISLRSIWAIPVRRSMLLTKCGKWLRTRTFLQRQRHCYPTSLEAVQDAYRDAVLNDPMPFERTVAKVRDSVENAVADLADK